MSVSFAAWWSNGEEEVTLTLETDAGYNPDVADDMGQQILRRLKEAMNDPTVMTPRFKLEDELEEAEETEE